MDRSNFNPDQLHEHFDRLKSNLGIELEDNAQMIKLPTGHRFAVGRGTAFQGLRHGDVADLHLSLHSEVGEVGTFTTSGYEDKTVDAVVVFNKDKKGNVQHDGGRRRRVYTRRTDLPMSHHIMWTNDPDMWINDPDEYGVYSMPPGSDRYKWYKNPDSETMDSIVNEVLERGGDISPDTLKGVGTIRMERYLGRPDDHSGFIGNVAMNRKSGRFEWVPD